MGTRKGESVPFRTDTPTNSPYILFFKFSKRGAQKQKKAPHYSLMKTFTFYFYQPSIRGTTWSRAANMRY